MQEQIEAVQRMQDYVNSHLFENITLADLSRVSSFSPWYSYRLFVEYVGITPANYIRKFRLSKSALKLRDNPCKIIDVAFEMGFRSVDGYQREKICLKQKQPPKNEPLRPSSNNKS